MKVTAMIVSSALVLVGAVMLAEASRHYPNGNYPATRHGSQYRNNLNLAAPVSHAYRCYGYHCKQSGYGSNRLVQSYPYGAASSATYSAGRTAANGPYHSYAVQPAIYGGRGLYHYRGYARYPSAPLYRKTRSCSGYNCNNGARLRAVAPIAQPIKALVLAPAYHGNYASTLPAYIPSYAPLRTSSYRSSDYAATGGRSYGKQSKSISGDY